MKRTYLVQGGKAEDDGWTILLSFFLFSICFFSGFWSPVLSVSVFCSSCCIVPSLSSLSSPHSWYSSVCVFFCPCFCLFASLSSGLFLFQSPPWFFSVLLPCSPLFCPPAFSPLSWPFSGFYSQRMSCGRLQIMRRPCMDFNAGITVGDSFVDV